MTIIRALAMGAALLWCGRAIAAAAPQHAPTEIWEGTLALPGGVGVRVVLRVTREGHQYHLHLAAWFILHLASSSWCTSSSKPCSGALAGATSCQCSRRRLR